MRDTFLGCFVLFSLGFVSCGSDEQKQETEIIENEPVSVKSCEDQTIADFGHFLNLEYGDEEQLLTPRLGKRTSGEYAGDSSLFIYHYVRTPRVPIQVWVDAENYKVKTIFMEVLSLEENFEADLQAAIKEYQLYECDVYWFGRTADEIKAQLGEPSSDVVTKEEINEITYISANQKYMAAFKIYPEQKDKCSSVAVTWFYD